RDFIGIYKADGQNPVQAIKSVVPNTFHIADPFLMKEKPVLFYTLTRAVKKGGKKRNFDIYPEIYFSRINDKGELLDFKPFPLNAPMEYGLINPFLDEQEGKLYFASNKAG